MKIYTKKGDQGATSLIGGEKVSKDHERINAYGTIDELNSYVGLVRDIVEEDQSRETLFHVQNILFNIGSLLASSEKSKMQLPEIDPGSIQLIEFEIDRLDTELHQLKNFILPGGHIHVSYCHIARTVCRRAERKVVALNGVGPLNPLILQFLNRLSDYLFVLARKVAMDLGVDEVQWKGT